MSLAGDKTQAETQSESQVRSLEDTLVYTGLRAQTASSLGAAWMPVPPLLSLFFLSCSDVGTSPPPVLYNSALIHSEMQLKFNS